jgi:hypothetical protein
LKPENDGQADATFCLSIDGFRVPVIQMVQYFKLGSWDRFILLLLLYGLLQAPFLLFSQDILVPEILWIRLGERLADGWRLYAQILDETAPIPAMVYALLAKLGLLDHHILRYLASFLVLMQALWFNQMAHRFQLVTERNYLIAFFYLIFSHLGPDCFSLSPVLMANTFVLFAFSRFFKILKDGASSDDAMVLGLLLGLSVLCYQPAVLFILPIYLSALFFTGLKPNQYLLILVAMLLPLGGVYTFFTVGGGESEFWTCFLSPFRIRFLMSLIGWELSLGLGGILLLVSLAGWAAANQNSRINFQRLGFTVFFFSVIMAFLTIFLGTVQSTDQLLFLVPHAAFFMAQFMLYTKGVLMQEIYSLLVCALLVSGFYGMVDVTFGKQILGHRLYLDNPPKGFTANFQNRDIMVLDNDFRFYKYNKPATRFFRYYLADINPNASQTFEGLIFWYQCLAENPPRLIYDPHMLIPALAVRMPEFGRCYRATFYPNLYEVIPGRKFGMQK